MSRVVKKYRDWPVLDQMPEGWKFDSGAGSPLHGAEFIVSPHGRLSGKQQRALLQVPIPKKEKTKKIPKKQFFTSDNKKIAKKDNHQEDISKPLNELCRLKSKELLLRDIAMDMAVCEIEGWDKMAYIKDLKSMIDWILRNDQ